MDLEKMSIKMLIIKKEKENNIIKETKPIKIK